MRVALAQVLTGHDPAQNLATVRHAITDAASRGAELVVFPEATMCAFGRPLAEVAEPLDGPWATAVRDAARAAGITVIAGMFTPAAGGRVHNTLLVAGATEGSYDKIHLYDAFGARESDTVTAGAQPVVVDIAGQRVGLATCYDVRFPGLFTELARRGARLIVVPASWADGPGKKEQWELLVRARALDSTSAVVACGQALPAAAGVTVSGATPRGVGGSLAISPLGEVLARCGEAPELRVVDVDLDQIDAVRRVLPVLENARPFV